MAISVPPIVQDREADTITYLTAAGGDVGAGFDTSPYVSVSVQAIGDATSVTITGSNDGGTTFSALGAGVTATIAGGKTPVTAVTPLAQRIRPEVTGGTSTKIAFFLKKQV